MRTVPLTKGLVALVDDDDYARVAHRSWHAVRGWKGHTYYAASRRPGRGPIEYLHRLLMEAPPRLTVDHINGDGLDCRRANLRLATRTQNAANHGGFPRKSPYRGVVASRNRWRAYIGSPRHGDRVYLGVFSSPEEAAMAYADAARARYGDFAPHWDHAPSEVVA